jgi:hypothetical protein
MTGSAGPEQPVTPLFGGAGGDRTGAVAIRLEYAYKSPSVAGVRSAGLCQHGELVEEARTVPGIANGGNVIRECAVLRVARHCIEKGWARLSIS